MADSKQTQSAYSTAQARTDEQKLALLKALADSGSAGAQAYKDAQKGVDTARQTAFNGIIPNDLAAGGSQQFANEQAQIINAPDQQAKADLSQGLASFDQYMQLQNNANANYMDQVKMAIPIEQTTTERAVQRILAEKELQLATLKASLARASGGGGGSGGGGSGSSLAQQKYDAEQQQGIFDNIISSYATDGDGNLMIGRATAINKIISLGVPIETAWAGLPSSDKDAIRSAVNTYYSNAGGGSPFPSYDDAWHSAHPVMQSSGPSGLGGVINRAKFAIGPGTTSVSGGAHHI